MRFAALLLFVSLAAGASFARAEFTAPALTGPVLDEPGLLRTGDRRELDRVLRDVNARGLAQIQIAIVDSLQGLTIEEASIKLFDQWKLGQKGKDNGLLFLISNGDRKMRFEVGRGLEGVLPDIRAKQILSDQVAPLFRAGRPSAGIVLGVSEALHLIVGDAGETAGQIAPEERSHSDTWMVLGFVVLMLILQLLRFATGFGGRGPRSRWGGGYGGSYGGGGWSSGGGGGGGWSGGGGGSAGGGASSGW